MGKHDKITIAGVGCALADFLYSGVGFGDEGFTAYRSLTAGDGGLVPGELVFTEELERFSGQKYADILHAITKGASCDAFNVGGPGIVPLIHVSQMLDEQEYEVKFFGICGEDAIAGRIRDIVGSTPLNIANYISTPHCSTPFTDVFSDRNYDGGHGERTFVNNIGAAWYYAADMLPGEFFQADIVCFGGTALLPAIHDQLTQLLHKAGQAGCVRVVNTVFDFRNEKRNPAARWPLGNNLQSYPMIDVLIMDKQEALRLSGERTLDQAAQYFAGCGVGSFFITNGGNDLIAYSDGTLFAPLPIAHFPVCNDVVAELAAYPALRGDTTGCGDNFAGGVITSLAMQLKQRAKGELDLRDAIAWGMASGGFACYYIGGVYSQQIPFEKRDKVLAYKDNYLRQLDECADLVKN